MGIEAAQTEWGRLQRICPLRGIVLVNNGCLRYWLLDQDHDS